MSSYSARYFLVLETDEVRSLPRAKLERLYKEAPSDEIPELAGQRIRSAEIVVSLDGRRADSVVRCIYGYKQFRPDGTLNVQRQVDDGRVVMEAGVPKLSVFRQPENVIDAVGTFAKKRRDRSIWWTPSAGLEKQILDCALGLAKCKRI